MAKPKPPGSKKPRPQARTRGKPALLAGGNPQIAKADGDAPVQAYIAAMPGWKRDVGRRLDEAQFAAWVKQASRRAGWSGK